MPKSIYLDYLVKQPNSNLHYLNRLIKVLIHFISIEPFINSRIYEDHHIVPESWMPEWDKISENHLKVPTKAHYVIHHLMYKAFPKDHSMQYAFWGIYNRLKQKITAKVYEGLKLDFIKTMSEWNSEKVKNGTHNFLGGEIARKSANERVSNRKSSLFRR